MNIASTNHSINADCLLVDEFNYKNKVHMVRLAKNGDVCSWSIASRCEDEPPTAVDVADILIVRGINNDHYFLNDIHHSKRRQKSNSSSILDSSLIKPCYSFEIHFVVRRKKRNFRIEQAIFCSRDALVVSKWIEELRRRVESFRKSPKNLLVFLNPYGGRKKAYEIYEKQVKPLFRLVGIQANLLVTERANHAYDYLVDNGWPNVDGIVCIGGDGTLSEVVNGVLMRLAYENNVNLNKPDVDIPSSDIRIGVIPAGSTDTIVYSLHGTSDIETAVIHILIGDYLKSDICSVHSEREYLSSFLSLISYGILGDVIKNSIDMRWMGPIRYDCAGARHFICHKSYEGTVSFLSEADQDEENLSICLQNDCHCLTKTNNYKLDEDKKWQLIRGKFFMVTAANISCACSRSPNGIAPHCHFADGYLSLLLIRRVTFCEKMRLLLTLSNSSKNRLVNKLDFVEIYRTRHFKFETGYGSGVIPATKISSWNIDGELMQTPHLHVRCHQQKLNMFCRRRQVERS